MYSLHDITSTCVKLETSDSTFTRESRYGVPTPGISAVKVEKTDEPCHLQIHQVMSRNEVVLQNGVTMRQKASPFPVNNIQDVASSKIVSNIEISAAQIQNSFRELSPDHGNRGLSSKMDTKGQIHVNQGIAYDHAPSNLAGTQGLSPTERITPPEEKAPMTVRKEEPKDSTILYDQRRDSTRVLSHQICTQMSGYQITSPDGIPCYKVCTTENTPAFFQRAQGEMPIHQIDPLAAMSGYKKDTQETRQKGYGEGPSSHQGISHQADSQGGISGHQIAATQSVSFKQLQKQEELSAGRIDAHSTTSGYQISNQGEILNHQSGSQHGMSPYKADIHSSKSGYQTEGWNGMSTLPIVSQNGLSTQWSSYNGMSPRPVGEMSGYMLSGQGPTFTDSVEKQDKKPFQQMGYQNGMPSQDMDLQNGMSTHQVAAQHGMSCYQVDVHDVNTTHPMGYQDGRSLAQIDVHGRPPPPYQMGTDEMMPGYPRLSHETRLPPNPITDYNNIGAYHTGFQENVKHQRMQFHQMDSLEMNAMPHSNTPHTCHCSCHLSSQPHSSHFPAFGLENQRPSVIMVPVAKSNIEVPVTSQIHSKGYIDDSDSSDESDNERKEKYFRRNIDGTTAKFKLTKEDWRRIPINSFPSGGRLLSGDWTRIFVNKVKESNPWCSLRFKNNHVRSENSRKIHSAVFFRGGAECKRPECNVKVRFVIRKEKGKYVEVTYVGNVCHRGQPSGSDFVNDRGRSKRVRRPRSFPD